LERSDTGGATSVAFVERAETSAVGRALANLGIDIALGQPDNAEHETVRGTASEQRRSNRAVTQRTPADPRPEARTGARLQQRADRVMEMAGLLGHAKRLGLSPAKLRVLRERVLRHDLDSATLTHIERRVRDWMERRMNRIEWRQ
jgi:hypothetical protein